MKTIWLVLPLVLLAGCAVGGSGIAICPAPRQSSCEAKMEAAMRMAEVIMQWRGSLTREDKAMWEAVKKECWREP